jgi:transglutaminase-like putative cysteine protease
VKLIITHRTEYKFSSRVFLEPHLLRFRPKAFPFISLEAFDFQVSPTPIGVSEGLDAENNFMCWCWFEGLHKKMSITSELVVENNNLNPFNFVIHPEHYSELPFQMDSSLSSPLQPALSKQEIGNSLLSYGKTLLDESKNLTIDFLSLLTRRIHQDFTLEVRKEGKPMAAATTFGLGRGSCRDFAWMQLQLLRNLGIATRFVSGYFYPVADVSEYELHAWVEVYLPGAGWVGFDPSHGIMAADSHVAIASSANAESTMSVTGTIRGESTSELFTKVDMQLIG